MAYAKDSGFSRGVGAIASMDHNKSRQRRRVEVARALAKRDRALSKLTMGPRGGLGSSGMVTSGGGVRGAATSPAIGQWHLARPSAIGPSASPIVTGRPYMRPVTLTPVVVINPGNSIATGSGTSGGTTIVSTDPTGGAGIATSSGTSTDPTSTDPTTTPPTLAPPIMIPDPGAPDPGDGSDGLTPTTVTTASTLPFGLTSTELLIGAAAIAAGLYFYSKRGK